METKMINLIKITAVSGIVIASLSTANATVNDENSVFPFNDLNRDVLIHKPVFDADDNNEFILSCYGCISTETYRPRTEYVRPHVRSNGTYVNGYWRS